MRSGLGRGGRPDRGIIIYLVILRIEGHDIGLGYTGGIALYTTSGRAKGGVCSHT